MPLGYRIEVRHDLPVIIAKIAFPPRLDVEHMFAEIARDIVRASYARWLRHLN